MTMPNPVLPFGLRDVRLIPVNADGTLGTPVDLPVARTFTFTETETFADLMGDDQTVASHGAGPTVDWDLESGGISFEAYQVMAGGTLVSSGTTPNQKKVFSKLTTDARPYFQVEGQAISDSGGDMHAIVYRCKANASLDGQFTNGAFYLTKAKGKGYGNNVGASPNFKLYDFVQNETVTPIQTVASIAITPLTLAVVHPAVAATKLVATATFVGGATGDISSLVTWITSAPTIATVDSNGFVQSIIAGSASISCKYQGITSTAPCVVTVS